MTGPFRAQDTTVIGGKVQHLDIVEDQRQGPPDQFLFRELQHFHGGVVDRFDDCAPSKTSSPPGNAW